MHTNRMLGDIMGLHTKSTWYPTIKSGCRIIDALGLFWGWLAIVGLLWRLMALCITRIFQVKTRLPLPGGSDLAIAIDIAFHRTMSQPYFQINFLPQSWDLNPTENPCSWRENAQTNEYRVSNEPSIKELMYSFIFLQGRTNSTNSTVHKRFCFTVCFFSYDARHIGHPV